MTRIKMPNLTKISSIVILLSGVVFAEVSVKSMMDKMDISKAVSTVADLNVSTVVNTVRDINVSKVIDNVSVDKGIDTMADMAKRFIDVGFSWKDNLENAFEEAKKSDKRIMVMVESENCRWCKKMLHRTIGDDKVQKKLAEKYVSVRVQREDLETMKNLPAVRGVPTVFLMDKDQNIIEEVIGYFDVLDFTSYLGDVDKKLKQ